MSAMSLALGDAEALLRGLSLATPRIAAAFLVLPILSRDDAPPLVRNAIFVALAMAALPYAGVAAQHSAQSAGTTAPFAGLLLKEVFIGVLIGFAFAGSLWAVAMAGDIIDNKAGASMATVVDPLAGHQTTLSGALLGRLASTVFIAMGGLTLFMDLLVGSYKLWPIHSLLPSLEPRALAYFARSFGAMMTLALMLAMPAVVLMSLVDLGLGIVNRYAPQLNVLPIAMAVKGWLASLILLVGLTVFVAVMVQGFERSRGLLFDLSRLFGP
jgi:type III secretion protein T